MPWGVELVVSAQTDLLDDHAVTIVKSTLPGDCVMQLSTESSDSFEVVSPTTEATDIFQLPGGLFLTRLSGTDWSYLEMVHPSDCAGSQVVDAQDGDRHWFTTKFRLLTDSLEKGVIRRVRVRGIFIRRDDDEAQALQCYQQFATAAPPLAS